MGGLVSAPAKDSYSFGVAADDEDSVATPGQDSKKAEKETKKKKTSKVLTELQSGEQPIVRDAGVRASKMRNTGQIAAKTKRNSREEANVAGKFSKHQQRKIRAVVKFGKGVREDTLEEKFAWIARNHHVRKVLTGRDVVLTTNTLGQGISGIVRLARLKESKKFCACKCVEKSRIARAKDAKRVYSERQALQECKSPFIVQLLGTYQDTSCVYFLLEYAVGGELFERLRQVDKLSNDVAKFYATEVLVAVEHVHSMGYMYRDLKPENVLLDEQGHIKLTDFGFAKLPENNGRCYTRLGTPQYLSPEMLEIRAKEGYTIAVDWWAWACMIFEFLTARTPFWRHHQDTRHEIYLRALKGKANWPTSIPKAVKGLLKRMLKPNLRKRLHEVEDIKKHEWFRGVDWNLVSAKALKVPYVPRVHSVGSTENFARVGEAQKGQRNDPVDQSLFAKF